MENEDYKKGEIVLIVGSGRGVDSHAELIARLKEHYEDMEIALLDMGETGIKAASARMALSEALKKVNYDLPLICPDEMTDIDMDFSRLESIVIDSLSFPEPKLVDFKGQCYDESGIISKKAWKKLKKNLEKIDSNLKPKSQKEIWCNKWNKKIKRKL